MNAEPLATDLAHLVIQPAIRAAVDPRRVAAAVAVAVIAVAIGFIFRWIYERKGGGPPLE